MNPTQPNSQPQQPMTDEQAYQILLREHRNLFGTITDLFAAGQTGQDILGAMFIGGAPAWLMRLTRQAIQHIYRVYA